MKFLDGLIRSIYVLVKRGTRGNESAIILSHKLRFRLFKYRLYKIELRTKTAYFITDTPLPKYKYRSYHISDGIQRLTDHLFILREKK